MSDSVFSPRGIGQFLSAHRQAVLIVLAVLELLILLAVFARWYDRRYGLRRAGRRARRAIGDAVRDLVAPIAEAIRFRRGVRRIAARLTESDPAAGVGDALSSARAELAGRADAWPYLVLIGPREVTVGIAGPDPRPEPETEAWEQRSGRRWSTSRPVPPPPLSGGQTAGDGYEPVPLAVGLSGDDLVFLDFGRAPGIVSVHGAATSVDRLVSALAVQLSAGLVVVAEKLLVHDAVLGPVAGRPLPELTAELEQRPAGRHPRTVLICSRPAEGDVVRLAELAGRDPGLLVLVAGYVPGSRWRLRVTSAGRVISPELGLDADGAPLRAGLEQVLTGRSAAAPEPPRARPIWADEEIPAVEPDPAPVEPPPPTPAVALDDLIEPAAGPVPVARSGADTTSPRPGER
ncbi:hypothetical protein [Actinoplanes sp. NPDC049265]|uniref:hypothetical protein n=1 Tax=Actinoplanes sp. NPDC049265 TaxID=3363902 RepID=UPI00371FD789